MRAALRRWWWVPPIVLAVLALSAWMMTGVLQGAAREAAADAAKIPVEQVAVGRGFDIHMTGFATEAERQAAIEAVDPLDSSWRVTADPVGESPTGKPTAPVVTLDPEVEPAEVELAEPGRPASVVVDEATAVEVEETLNDLFALEPIEFDALRVTIRPGSQATLDDAAAVINDNPEIGRLKVVGHTDSDGESASNQSLSQRRAQAVVDYLVSSAGVDPDRLVAEGRGEDELLANPETSADDKQRNRRIEWERRR